jgi:hypothetical protein
MRLLLALVLAVALAAPVAAEMAPTLRTERTWFHCAGAAKVQNAEYAQRNVPTWNTIAPAQSVQQGAGCGYFENAGGGYLGPNETTLDSIWEGSFAGNLDSLTIELHNIHASAARASGPFLLRANLLIDGVDVINPDAPQIEVTPVPSSSRLSEMLRFTVTGIGLRSEEGDGQQVRRVRLIIRSLSEEQSAWVWDTTEVPAGLTFNPAAPEAVTLTARLRS